MSFSTWILGEFLEFHRSTHLGLHRTRTPLLTVLTSTEHRSMPTQELAFGCEGARRRKATWWSQPFHTWVDLPICRDIP
jgi:hypothetical protein